MKVGDFVSIKQEYINEVVNDRGYVPKYKKLMLDIYNGVIPNKFVLTFFDDGRFNIYGWTWGTLRVNNIITPYKEQSIFNDDDIFTM